MDQRRIRSIKPFLEKVKRKYSPQEIILFGSRAKGTHHKDSDYDLLIIAESFRKIDFYDRCVLMYKLKRGLKVSMDNVCLTPEEFEHRRKLLGIIQEAVREGVVI